MTGPDDIKKLAALARIRVADDALPKLAGEIDGILSYVGQLESLVTTGAVKDAGTPRNVLREDANPTPAHANTEKMTAQFPDRDGDSLKVKQIISHD